MPPLPANCRWLIRLASGLVPRSSRTEWRRRWEHHLGHWHAFLREHGQWTREARAELVNQSWRAFPDAFWSRFDRDQFLLRVRHFSGSPRFLLAALGAYLLLIGAATGGLSSTRRAFSPSPFVKPDGLVLVSQPSQLRQRAGVRIATARLWQEHSQTLSGLAAWYLRPVRLSDPARNLSAAHVTPNFFSLLGDPPALGRTFRSEDASAAPRPVLLSHRLWQAGFRSDPAILGRPLEVDGRPAVVAGVLPRSFWAISQRIDLWLPFQPDPYGGLPFLVSAVARLQPGVTIEQAQAELRALVRKDRIYGAGADLASLADRVRPFRRSLLTALLPSMVLAVAAVLMVAGRLALAALGRGSLRYTWRYWSFFAMKTSLLIAGLAAAWIELKCRAILNLNLLADPVIGGVLSWLFLLASVGALGLSIHDQRQRCPVCLSRLSLPVTLGSWSSALFDPARTELLCEHGHGALYVPDTGSSASESERWYALDSSWLDLFPQTKR